MTTLLDLIDRTHPPSPWAEGDNIPWNDPVFSERMLAEHLSQDHDLASRRAATIDAHVDWIHRVLLDRRPSRILDLACGPGLYLTRLAELGHRGVGIDFAPAAIAHARRIATDAGSELAFFEADLRSADFGTGFDLVTLLYGQLNVFPRGDAAAIVKRAAAALVAGGTFIAEPQTIDHVRSAAMAGPSWSSHRSGLFSDRPHLMLTEAFWDPDLHASTQRFHIVDAATGAVTSHAMSNEAYTEGELAGLLSAAGLRDIEFASALGTGEASEGLQVVMGRA